MSEDQKEQAADTNVVGIDKSPLTIGQKNYLKKVFSSHKAEVETKVATHRKEISKIFETYSKQVAESIAGQNKEMVKQMNESLASVDKKFSGMYSVLINKFLVKQEEKVFLCELGVQALLEVFAGRIHKALSQACAPGSVPALEQFQEEVQKEVEDKITYLAEEMKKEAEAKALAESSQAQQNGEQNAGEDQKAAGEVVPPAEAAPQNGE